MNAVLLSTIIVSVLIILGLIVFGFALSRIYKKATKEQAFVRTGLGGEKVVMSGGALVLPILHDIVPVNMKTLKLNVSRSKESALITKDRMRVDVDSDFYIRVKPTKEGVSLAAQTLGHTTLEPENLKKLIEGKLVDALRNVAAKMSLSELHENRENFVQQVQNVLREDLAKNGLELESVSLTSLDQTDPQYLNPEANAFDAEGAKKLVEITQRNKEERNKIEKETEVKIKQKDLEAKKMKLEIEQQEKILEAEQKAKIAEEEARKMKEAEEARIEAEKEIERKRIEKEKAIQESEIEKEKILKAQEIEKEKELEAKKIEKEKAIKAKDIEKEQQIKEKDIAKEIAIAEKIKEESLKRKEANLAKAEEVRAQEKIKTAEEIEKAEREKQLAIVEAQKEAEQQAIEKKVVAEAEKEAAKDLAEAIKIQAEAKEKEYEVEAEGKRKLIEAENALSERVIEYRIKEAIIKAAPELAKQLVEPMKNIQSIKIAEIGGLNSSTGVSGTESGTNTINVSTGLSNEIVNAALKYKANVPLVEGLLKEVGLDPQTVMQGEMFEQQIVTNKKTESKKTQKNPTSFKRNKNN